MAKMNKTKKQQQHQKPKHSIINNVFYLLQNIYKEKKVLFLLLFIESICGILSPLFGIYLPKYAVDLVTEGAGTDKIILKLGLFTAAMAVVYAVNYMARYAKYMHYNNLRQVYLKKMFLKYIDCDYMETENVDGQTRYTRAVNTLRWGDGSGTSRMIVCMIAIFTSAVSFILYSGVISMLNPLIIIYLFILTGINYFSLSFARKYEEKHRGEVAAIEKKLDYIESKSGDIAAGKDIRLYNMTGWFLALKDNLLNAYAIVNNKIKNRHYLTGIVNALTLFLRDGGAYVYLIYMVSKGNISIGAFMLYFGAITGFSGFISSIVGNLNEISMANIEMNHMRSFLEFTDSPEPAAPSPIPALDSPLSISFRNVCFSYSLNSGNILSNLNLDIKAGEKVALVGINGAGKTTIVKLLCGFYTPDSGDILINGINIKNYHRKELFKLFSAVFQDITILPFTIAENVSMRLESQTDKSLVRQCLEKAGLYTDISRYKDGIDTNMDKVNSDGIVLSGGQQQKLLMARALYKNAPLMILDEPTAALDPIAESETYSKFHELSANKTSIYISHRLASTRFCDRIVYLKDGSIYESGTHEELMDKDGEYANMFNIQSHYYADSEVPDNNIS